MARPEPAVCFRPKPASCFCGREPWTHEKGVVGAPGANHFPKTFGVSKASIARLKTRGERDGGGSRYEVWVCIGY